MGSVVRGARNVYFVKKLKKFSACVDINFSMDITVEAEDEDQARDLIEAEAYRTYLTAATDGVDATVGDVTEEDYVKVQGDFYTAGDPYYHDKKGIRVDEVFTAGTFEIGKGFYQLLTSEDPVRASGTHRFLIKGSGEHTVSFMNRDNYIAVLETEGDVSVGWKGWFCPTCVSAGSHPVTIVTWAG